MTIAASTMSLATKLPSPEVASNIDADGLNKLWNELATAFDAYYDSIEPPAIRDVVNKAIADWQNFYYAGLTGGWTADGMVLWRTVYQKTIQTLSAAIPAGAQPQAQVSAPAKPGKQTDDVFYISGRTEPSIIRDVVVPHFVSPINLSSPAWLGLLAIGLPVATYLFARKRSAR
jgi:hypothetical protein